MTEFFDVKNFSLRPVLVFTVILLLFGCYVTQIHCLCNHHRVDRALRLMFSHYFVVIALNLVMVSFKFLENPEASRLFTAELMRTAVILFFIAIYSDSIYYHSGSGLKGKRYSCLKIKSALIFMRIRLQMLFERQWRIWGLIPWKKTASLCRNGVRKNIWLSWMRRKLITPSSLLRYLIFITVMPKWPEKLPGRSMRKLQILSEAIRTDSVLPGLYRFRISKEKTF
ncbi:hypothetical protein SAMN02745687_02504 [Lachnospiraceae bacterium NK3A20]|nr:hypothetical protein SAMN02745687_02504 [Lachnospiraceae bacterium NK3A20]